LEPDFFLMENVAGLLTSGARPKIGSYVRKLGKSIGVPASQVVELLPEVSTSLAKRDKQFRKRTVSEAVTSYKSNLIKNHFDLLVPEAYAEALTHIHGTLPFWLKDNISDAYKVKNVPSDDEKIIQSALNSSKAVLSQLAIGLFIDILMDSKSLTEADAKDYLLELSNGKRIPKEIKSTLIKLLEEYDAAPDSTVYKGVTVGPIISHLIDRASEKYDVSAPTLLNAAWFGTPQARQRLFVIGINKRLKKSFVFPNKQFSIPNPDTPTLGNILVDAPTVFQAIGDLPDIDQFSELLDGAEFASSNLNHEDYSEYASKMRLDEIERGNFSLPRPTWNPFVIDCSNRTIHTEDVIERLKQTDEGIQEETSHKTRLNRLKVSHTLRAGTREGKGSHTAVRPVHYEYHRVISVREGARLMGYPDWMTFHHTKWHGFRLVGNGVPFQLGNALAKALKAQLNLSPDESTNDSASE